MDKVSQVLYARTAANPPGPLRTFASKTHGQPATLLRCMKRVLAFFLLTLVATAVRSDPLPELYAPEGTLLLEHLASAPFPHPQRAHGHEYEGKIYDAAGHYSDNTVAIFIPRGFSQNGRVDFVVHFHGWKNHVEAVLRHYQLIEQFVASRRNAVLVRSGSHNGRPAAQSTRSDAQRSCT